MSNKNQVILKPASPPADWKEVRRELREQQSPVMNVAYAIPVCIFGFATVLLAHLSLGFIASVPIFLATMAFLWFVLKSTPSSDFGHYATWIYQTVPPTSAKLELTVKHVGRYGTIYKAKVIDPEGQEEIYDICTVFPVIENAAALCDRVSEAKVYRDPVNHQCVAAQVGEIIVWLWEYTPLW